MSIPSETCTRCRSGTEFRGWRHPLDQPHRWTPPFCLDDAVALAARHRPCALCRRDAYRTYRDALTTTLDRDKPVRAFEINARVNAFGSLALFSVGALIPRHRQSLRNRHRLRQRPLFGRSCVPCSSV